MAKYRFRMLDACGPLLVSLLLVGCLGKDPRPAGTVADSTAASASKADSVVHSWVATDTSSVLEQLRSRHQIESVESSMGVFVKGIDSVINDQSTYWIYKVNDTMVPLGAGLFHTRTGDTVRWIFRKM